MQSGMKQSHLEDDKLIFGHYGYGHPVIKMMKDHRVFFYMSPLRRPGFLNEAI